MSESKITAGLRSAVEIATCEHRLTLISADRERQVYRCHQCGCRLTTWPGNDTWDWHEKQIASLRSLLKEAMEALRVADEALALVPADNGRCQPDAWKARAEISRARSLLERSKTNG
jgi:hypothetical protein